jgi:hypothetical protein
MVYSFRYSGPSLPGSRFVQPETKTHLKAETHGCRSIRLAF